MMMMPVTMVMVKVKMVVIPVQMSQPPHEASHAAGMVIVLGRATAIVRVGLEHGDVWWFNM